MEPMTHAMRRPPKTVEDYLALPDDVRAELIGGELYVTPSPDEHHQRISQEICVLLRNALGRTAFGEVFYAPLDVHLPGGDVVQPDLLVVARERASIVERWVYGAPDLVVEILSPTHRERDLVVKRHLYARAGVREYWIVDGEPRGVEVLALEGEAYEPRGWFTGARELVSPLLGPLGATADSLFPPEA
jgi:Uma2 family endonuclease